MGCAAGQGITLYTSRRRLRAWRRVRQRGAQLDGAFAFYSSRRQLRAWPGGGNGGVRGWTGNHFVRLSLTSGQAPRRRRRVAQLDGEFAFYASRRRLRARTGGGGRTGSLLSTPLAANFGPGQEEATEGCAAGQGIALYASSRLREAAAESRSAGRGVCFLCLSPPTSGQDQRRRQDGEFAFYASRHRLRAWLGGGGGRERSWRYFFLRLASPTLGLAREGGGRGARSWTGSLPSMPLAANFGPCLDGAVEGRAAWAWSFAFLSFTHWPLDARPSYAWSLVPTLSKTVDQILPP